MSDAPIIMYGMKISGNTARARSYLIKAGIAYTEKAPATLRFITEIVPKASGIRTMPTFEFADGTVLRDGAAMIQHFEDLSGHTFSPGTPKQNLVSRLFDTLGADGMFRPGMHYRWSFPEHNLAFIDWNTFRVLPPGFQTREFAEQAHDQMRTATKRLGISPETAPMIEALYADQLAAFEAHLSDHPYIMGGRPCIGDFGMMIMWHAHLGRDPKPLPMMLRDGPAVFRWTERMNIAAEETTEYETYSHWGEFFPEDAIPQTLIDLMKVYAEDYVPETLAAAEAINHWLSENDPEPGSKAERSYGFAQFEVRGTPVGASAQPYRFFLLQRVQQIYDAMDQATRAEMDAILDAANLRPIIDARLSRTVGRRDNCEAWL